MRQCEEFGEHEDTMVIIKRMYQGGTWNVDTMDMKRVKYNVYSHDKN
jgi:hypothetical protein